MGDGSDWKKRYEELQVDYALFKQQSNEVEAELEKEIAEITKEKESLERKHEKAKELLENLQSDTSSNNRTATDQITKLQTLVSQYQREIVVLQSEKRKLEQEKDDLENKVRRQEALIEDQKEKLEAALEDQVLLQGEVEETQAEKDETIQRLRQELLDIQSELQVVKRKGHANGSERPDEGKGPAASEEPSGGASGAVEEGGDLTQAMEGEAPTEPIEGETTTGEGGEQVEDLQSRVRALEDDLQEQGEINEQLREDVKDLTNDFLKANEKVEQLETKLREHEAAKESQKKDTNNAAELDSLRLEHENLMNEWTQLNEENKTLKEKVSKLDQALSEQAQLVQPVPSVRENENGHPKDFYSPETKEEKQEKDEREGHRKENILLRQQIEAYQLEMGQLKSKIKDMEMQLQQAVQHALGTEKIKDLLNGKDLYKGLDKDKDKDKVKRTSIVGITSVPDDDPSNTSPLLRPRARTIHALSPSTSTSSTSTSTGQSKNALTALKTSVHKLKQELSDSSAGMTDIFVNMRDAITKLSSLTHSAQKNLEVENLERRKLFEEIQDIKGGNIRVFCRIRPILEGEKKQKDSAAIVEVTNERQVQLIANQVSGLVEREPFSGSEPIEKSFSFDRVFGAHSTQEECFRDVQALIFSVLHGHNVCIFAYGQTGSGKTYTMEGPPENPGIYYRSMEALFTQLEQRQPQFKYQIKANMVEIYNEQLRDLLADLEIPGVQLIRPAEKNAKLQIRQGAEGIGVRGKRTYVSNATSAVVETVDQVLRILGMGSQNRAVESTALNDHSSRSHLLLLVDVEGVNQLTQDTTYGKLCLVDLAGSERVKQSESVGQRLKEATYINKSLSALGDVMKALGTRSASGKSKKEIHVPYRNSKLTYLLQDALGGNSKTLMFVNISPSSLHGGETLQSLQFAHRVRKVKLEASVAAVENGALSKYKSMIDELKEQTKAQSSTLVKRATKAETLAREQETEINHLRGQLKTLQDQFKVIEASRLKENEETKELAKTAERKLQKKLLVLEGTVKEKDQLVAKLENKLKSKDDQTTRRAEQKTAEKAKEKELRDVKQQQEQMRKLKQLSTENKRVEEKYVQQIKDLSDKESVFQRKLKILQEETDKYKADCETRLNTVNSKYQASLKIINALEARAEAAEKKSRALLVARKKLDQSLEEAKEVNRKMAKVKEKQIDAYKEKHKKLLDHIRLMRDRRGSKSGGATTPYDKELRDLETMSINSADFAEPTTPRHSAPSPGPAGSSFFPNSTSSSSPIVTSSASSSSSLSSPQGSTPSRIARLRGLSQASMLSGDLSRVETRPRRDSRSSQRSGVIPASSSLPSSLSSLLSSTIAPPTTAPNSANPSTSNPGNRTPTGRRTPAPGIGDIKTGRSSLPSSASRTSLVGSANPTTALSKGRSKIPTPKTPLRDRPIADKETRERLKEKMRDDLEAKVAAKRDARALKSAASPSNSNIPRKSTSAPQTRNPISNSSISSTSISSQLASIDMPNSNTSVPSLLPNSIPVSTTYAMLAAEEQERERKEKEATQRDLDDAPTKGETLVDEEGLSSSLNKSSDHDTQSVNGSECDTVMSDLQGEKSLGDPRFVKARPTSIITSTGSTSTETESKDPNDPPSALSVSSVQSNTDHHPARPHASPSKIPSRPSSKSKKGAQGLTIATAGLSGVPLSQPLINSANSAVSPEKKARIIKPVVLKGKGSSVGRQPSPARKPKPSGKTVLVKAPPKEKPKEKKQEIPANLIKIQTAEKKVPAAPPKPPPFAHTMSDFDLFTAGLDSLVDLDGIKSTLSSSSQTST